MILQSYCSLSYSHVFISLNRHLNQRLKEDDFAFHTVIDHVFLFGKNASHATHTLFCILIPTLDQGYTVSSNFKIPSEEVGI